MHSERLEQVRRLVRAHSLGPAVHGRPAGDGKAQQGPRRRPATLGVSRYTRQLGSGCRGMRDSRARDVALYAAANPQLSRIPRQLAPDVASYATIADERTHAIDERTCRFDERTRDFDDRTRASTNEPDGRQLLVRERFSAALGRSPAIPNTVKSDSAQRFRAGACVAGRYRL